MAVDITEAFVKQFESEVHEAYQRRGALLRQTVRTKTGVRGTSTTFQKAGTGTASQKSRHGTVPPMNQDHTPVECFLQDWYGGDWVDKLDELKINHDERQVVANAAAYALGRKTDEMIILELDSAEVGPAVINASAIAVNTLSSWAAELGGRNVPMVVGEAFGVVSWPVWSRMLDLPQFSSQDYVGLELPFKGMTFSSKIWADVIWMPHSGLSGPATAKECHVWHRSAVGHAIGAEVSMDIWWNGERRAHWVNAEMSQGAKLIDALGVVTRRFNETA
jgi:hypothetical protein